MHFTMLESLYVSNRVRGPYCKLQTEYFPVDLWTALFFFFFALQDDIADDRPLPALNNKR